MWAARMARKGFLLRNMKYTRISKKKSAYHENFLKVITEEDNYKMT